MIKYIKEKDFIEETNSKVLVDFYADWCAPCKMLGLVMEKCHESLNIPILKVNVDEEGNLASKYNVSSIPTLIIFENNKEVKRITGFLPEDELKKWIDE